MRFRSASLLLVGVLSTCMLTSQVSRAFPSPFTRIASAAEPLPTIYIGGQPWSAENNGDGGPSIDGVLSSYVTDLAVDDEGNLFIADRDWRQIRRIDVSTGLISSIFDERRGTWPTYCDSPHTSPISGALGFPWSLATFGTDLYFSIGCDGGGRVRLYRWSSESGITPVAGGRYCPSTSFSGCLIGDVYGGDGGPALGAGLGSIDGIAITDDGDIYFADSTACRVRKIENSTQIITTIAGTTCAYGSVVEMSAPLGDGGLAVEAQFYQPSRLALSNDDSRLYVLSEADGGKGRRVRVIDLVTGVITTAAGTGAEGIDGDGGPATAARIYPTISISVLSDDRLVLFSPGPYGPGVNSPYNLIRAVDATGTISQFMRIDGPIAGRGAVGADGSLYVLSRVDPSEGQVSYQLVRYPPEVTGVGATPTCTITGTSDSDSINGTAGNDVICGLAGNDQISGGGGTDVIVGGDGDDVIQCGSGCAADGGSGNDEITLSGDGGTALGGGGDDVLTGGGGDDTLVGGDGTDYLEGNSGVDLIDGGNGEDILFSYSDSVVQFSSVSRSVSPFVGATDAINLLTGGFGKDLISSQPRDTVTAGGQSDVCSGSSYYMVGCSVGRIRVTRAPTQPRAVQSTTQGSVTTLSWRNPSNWRNESLRFDVRLDGTTICTNVTARSCTANRLTLGSRHSVQVRARNTNGTSSWSTPHDFTIRTSFQLSLSKTGTGSGSVTSDPTGINCGTTCTATFVSGTSVTLTATPASGSRFTRWTGACTGSSTTCTVSVTRARSVTATFRRT